MESIVSDFSWNVEGVLLRRERASGIRWSGDDVSSEEGARFICDHASSSVEISRQQGSYIGKTQSYTMHMLGDTQLSMMRAQRKGLWARVCATLI